MKNLRNCALVASMFALVLTSTVSAQPGMGMGRQLRQQANNNDPAMPYCMRGNMNNRWGFEKLNLTDDQKAKIKDLKIAHQRESLTLRNKMQELRAHLQTLSTADKADLKAINATIDEITQTMNALMKSREAFRQQVRALLTEEQRIEFDLNASKRMMKHKGMKNVMQPGMMPMNE